MRRIHKLSFARNRRVARFFLVWIITVEILEVGGKMGNTELSHYSKSLPVKRFTSGVRHAACVGIIVEELQFPGGPLHKLALLALFAVIQVGGADPRIGSWTLTSAESSLDPPNKLMIVPEHGTVHVTISGNSHADFTANVNGHDTAVQNNPAFDQIELKRIDKRHVELRQKKAGALVATISDQLSKDGKELTSRTSQPGRADKVSVFERTGGKKSATDLFAGEWTEDLSKSRLGQGMMLKIEANGSDGVRFSGDYSYSARFDGKQYDLKNSVNDSIVLQLVDPHTVDAIYRRGDQITQKDRWVVSADGTQMTLTTSGTLETGQQVKETLVFRKQ